MSQRYIGGLIYNPPGGFSGYFDGNGDWLNTPANAAFTLGTGDYTIEMWVLLAAVGREHSLFDFRNNVNTSGAHFITTGDKLAIWNGSTVVGGTGASVPANAWTHIAYVRSSGSITAYLNGVAQWTAAYADNLSNNTLAICGSFQGLTTLQGYASNARVVKGTAVYTAAFTPPVGPLQAITNTSLLTCAYGTFRDGSSNNFTITVNGNTAVSTQNPFPQTQLPNPALGNQGNGVYSMSQYQALRSQNLWPAIDPYFDYVTLMLHGNGTNGAQNNTFLDSSTNNFTITRNGNTTQGTFTPYGSNWSNYFDGTGDYLSLPSSTNLALGTGAFTIEAWVFNASTEALFPSIGACSSPSGITQFGFTNSANSVTRVVLGNLDYPSSGNSILLKGSASVGVGQWAHVAYVRDSGVITIYLNGVSVGTVSDARDSVQQLRSVGASYSTYFAGLFFEWLGNISNLRFVKGSAVYTSAFTPSTAPITAITNTQLLTCQSNRFIDNSTNNFTITRNGDVSVQRFSPFNPTTPYAAGTIGGSGYFDGSGDYLTLPTSQTPLLLGNSDFTLEAWVYRQSGTGTAAIFCGQSNLNTAAGSGYVLYVSSSSNSEVYIGSSSLGVTSPNPSLGQWAHVALVRTGGVLSTYLNGARVGTRSDLGTSSINDGSTSFPPSIGGFANGGSVLNGYIAGARIIKGSGGYDATQATITVPTAPPTAITNTSLLLNFTNGGIIDNAMMNDLETVGNAQISTSVSKFGGGSLAFDGTGDYLLGPSSENYAFRTGDFTVECWVYITANQSFATLIDTTGNGGASASFGWLLEYSASRGMVFFIGNSGAGTTLTFATTPATGVWTHLAATRSGSTLRLFINGTSVASGTYTNDITMRSAASVSVGAAGGNQYLLNGYIDDLRITKGYARYTANFTPQRSQWQDQ